jgi:hypothetical protein
VEPERPQTIWCMPVACSISKATCAKAHTCMCASTARVHAHTEIFSTACPLQQWFCERASVSHYTYIACLVTSCFYLHSRMSSKQGISTDRLMFYITSLCISHKEFPSPVVNLTFTQGCQMPSSVLMLSTLDWKSHFVCCHLTYLSVDQVTFLSDVSDFCVIGQAVKGSFVLLAH